MEAGAFEQAADLFDSSAVQSPHFKTYELLGECYMRLRRFTEAIPYLAAATTLNHGARAPSLLAEAWLAIDRRDKAVEAVEAADLALSRDSKNKIAFRVREIAATKVDKKGHDDVV